ncbi:hypothetical protein PUV54_07515 [Hyphococcus flavus]|uniref:Uncharacterized protein n=1 Tax=Hyphococcus flavus TaxID=1866326 RepID=A0AAF0CG29_9PROT|nr:hypothetical protein [Hyphococcus flavus]WDI33041.1 hypothetical protein PUV54_07515 [Hyphococcus flavus]
MHAALGDACQPENPFVADETGIRPHCARVDDPGSGGRPHAQDDSGGDGVVDSEVADVTPQVEQTGNDADCASTSARTSGADARSNWAGFQLRAAASAEAMFKVKVSPGNISALIQGSKDAFMATVAEIRDSKSCEATHMPAKPVRPAAHRRRPHGAQVAQKKCRRRRPLLAAAVVCALAVSGAAAAQLAAPETTDRLFRAVIAAATDKSVVDEVQQKLDCAEAFSIVADSGGPVFLSKPGCAANTGFLSAPFSDDRKSSFIDGAKKGEGDYALASPAAIVGVNIPGKRRVITSGFNSAGTGLGMTAFEALLRALRPYLSATEKLNGFFKYIAFVAHQKDDAMLDEIVALVPTCTGRGAPVAGVYGGEICRAMLFPTSGNESITIAETCLLAAGINEPLLITSSKAPATIQLEAQNRLAERKVPARRCLRDAYERGEIDRDGYRTAKVWLDSYKAPTIEDFGGLGPNPQRWLDRRLPMAREVLKDGVRLLAGQPRRLKTSLIPPAQQALDTAVRTELETTIGDRLSEDVCVAGCSTPIDFIVAVAERRIDSRLEILAVAASDEGLLHGPVANDGTVGRPHRSGGSAGKQASSVCGVKLSSQMQICRSDRWGLKDPGGVEATSCSNPSDFVSPMQIMARSLNSAFAEWLRDIPDEQLRACLKTMGATIHDGLDADQLRRTTAVGTKVVYTPAALMRASSAIAFGSAALPTLFDQQAHEGSVLDLHAFLTNEQYSEVRRLAIGSAAPAGGTLAGFSVADCTTRALKTGTVDSYSNYEVRDKVLVWSGVCDDRELTAFVMIGSPYIDRPLGDVRSVEAASLLRRSITAVASAKVEEIER